MDAERSGIVFFTDRNLGKMVPRLLREDGWSVESHFDHFADDTQDPELLEAVGRRDWVFLTQDFRLRYRPAEKKALLDHGLKVFYLTSAQLRTAEKVEILTAARSRIDAALASTEAPFVYSVHKNGTVHLKLAGHDVLDYEDD